MNAPATINELESGKYWDGVRRSYIPRAELDLPQDLKLHRDTGAEVDPVTFEVVRYALINANLEHTRLIQRLAVSPIVMIARDMQTAILNEVGDLIVLGPNVQYFANSQALATKWVLENRSISPGIEEGDIFMSNDPFIGSAHHQDTNLMMPVFVDGALFCWITNTLHFADVGGTSPGSFCIAADDAWSDPPAFPAVKLVERDRIRADIEDLFLRQSRMRVNVQMDLRAAVAAAQTTARRMLQIIARYGAATVKNVMTRVFSASADLLRERLAQIPDGRWSARSYVEASVPGDRGIYRYQINLEKRGDRLYVDNRGTDRQTGAINCTFAPFSGAFMTSAIQALVPDLAGCFGGAYGCIEFKPVSGLLNCAEHPAAVSPSGAATSEVMVNLSTIVVAKMLATGDAAARSSMIGTPQPTFYSHLYAGLDASGAPFVQPTSDNMIGSQGGTAEFDGIDAGGAFWMPGAIAENVEQTEDSYPILCLFRRLQTGGHQGAGRHRGGLGTQICSTPWNAGHFQIEMATNEGFVRANGLAGGNPGGLGASRVIRGGLDWSASEPWAGIDANADEDVLPPKALGIVLAPGDLVVWTCAATGGFGDPLRRDPARCLAEAEAGLFDAAQLREIYGVVVSTEGGKLTLDSAATEALRQSMRSNRLGRSAAPTLSADDVAGLVRTGDALGISATHWHCCGCGGELGPLDAGYKACTERRDHPIDSFAPGFESPHPDLAGRMEFREFLCGHCGTRIDTEIALKEDEPLDDVRVFARIP